MAGEFDVVMDERTAFLRWLAAPPPRPCPVCGGSSGSDHSPRCRPPVVELPECLRESGGGSEGQPRSLDPPRLVRLPGSDGSGPLG